MYTSGSGNAKNFVSDHQKFLKPKFNQLQIGDYIPNVLVSMGNKLVSTYDLISNYHLLLFCYSTSCSSCENSLESLYQFTERAPKFNVSVFIDTSEENYQFVKQTFKRTANVFRVEKKLLIQELQTISIPRGYCINHKGQVLATNSALNEFWFDKLIEPLELLRIEDNRNEIH